MNFALKNLDTIILSTPVVMTATIGSGFSFLENSEIPVASSIGWLGTRVCMVMMPMAGTPLLVWSLAKTIFVKTLSALTCNKLQCLKNYADECDTNMKYIYISVPAIALLMPHVPTVIKTAKSVYDFYDKFKDGFDKVSALYTNAKTEWDKFMAHFKEESKKGEEGSLLYV